MSTFLKIPYGIIRVYTKCNYGLNNINIHNCGHNINDCLRNYIDYPVLNTIISHGIPFIRYRYKNNNIYGLRIGFMKNLNDIYDLLSYNDFEYDINLNNNLFILNN